MVRLRKLSVGIMNTNDMPPPECSWLRANASTLFLGVLLLTVAWGSMTAVASHVYSSQDQLAVDSAVIDLGTVSRGGKQKCVFRATNVCSDQIRIASVRPPCSCSDADVESSPSRLKPSESGEISLSWQVPITQGRQHADFVATFSVGEAPQVNLLSSNLMFTAMCDVAVDSTAREVFVTIPERSRK